MDNSNQSEILMQTLNIIAEIVAQLHREAGTVWCSEKLAKIAALQKQLNTKP